MAVVSIESLTSAAKAHKEAVVGIDLGTTFSLAAWVDGEVPKVIRDENGQVLVPSVVSFTDDNDVIVGWPARERGLLDPEHTVFSVKRLIGRGREDLARELGLLPYQVEDAERKLVRIKIRENRLTPQEVSAEILKDVKARAEKVLNRKVTKAVITVPAYFDDTQRQATRDAGRIAGLDVLRIINEPTAAALAYGLDSKKKGIIAVYDLGGGTFDISILRIAKGVFQVLSTLGDTFLGGDDFDRTLMDLASTELKETHPEELIKSPVVLQALKQAAEKTKQELSSFETATLQIQLDDPKISYVRQISRAEFNELIGPLVERTIEFCKTAISDARLTPERIEDIVMVGGSTRVPLVSNKVEEFFGKPLHTDLNPDEVVALGAAVQARILSGGFKEMMVLDVTPLSLGIETFGGGMSKLIMRNSSIPTRASEQFTTYVDGQTSVDIHVLQGERELAEDCRSLGKWKLTDIPAMPANAPKITVTFILDANGVLKVDASEERSGKELSIEVQPSSGLTEEEVERMVRESIEHAKSDVENRQRIDLRNEIDSIGRATVKALEQTRDDCPEALRSTVEKALIDLLAAAELEDIHQIQQAIDDFNEASEPLAKLQMDAVAKTVLREEQSANR